MIAEAFPGAVVGNLASDLTREGLLGVCERGGDLEMAVPGLASFLAFFSRPQTPSGYGGGGWAGREGGLLGTHPALPFPFQPLRPTPPSVCLTLHHPSRTQAWDCVSRPPTPNPVLTSGHTLGLPGAGIHAGVQGQTI